MNLQEKKEKEERVPIWMRGGVYEMMCVIVPALITLIGGEIYLIVR